MPYNHPRLNYLRGGWYVVFEDGSVLTEEEMPWIKVPNKKNIKLMGLKRHNKYYELEGKENYIPPGETHMKDLSFGDGKLRITKSTLISWYIGFYDTVGKNYLRVCSKTGKVTREVIPYEKEERDSGI